MTTLSSHVSPYAGPPERLPADPPPLCAVCDLHEPVDESGRCDSCIGRSALGFDDLLAACAHLEQRARRAEQALAMERRLRAEGGSRDYDPANCTHECNGPRDCVGTERGCRHCGCSVCDVPDTEGASR